MVCQGNTRLLLVLEWCYKTDSERYKCMSTPCIVRMSDISCASGEFRGHGNSFHGHGGHGSRLAQLRMCIRVLLSMCQVRDEVTMQDLHDQGAIPLLVGKLSTHILLLWRD